MRRIMIICFGFPPDISGSSFNIESIAKELSLNNEVLVVVTNWYHAERTRKQSVDKNLRVIQLSHSKASIFVYRILRKLSLVFKCDNLHWISELFLAYTYKQAFQIANEYKPDSVITTCYPFANHLIGREIKRKIGIKWIAYYQDPFFCDDTELFYRKNWIAYKERSVVSEVDRIVILRWMKEIYSEYRVLPNDKLWCIDLPVKRIDGVIKTYKERKLTFVYIGTLYKGVRSPDVLFEFIRKLNECMSDTIELIMIGKISGYSMDDVHEWEEEYSDCFKYHGIIEHNQLINYFNVADALISVGNTNKTQMPSKVFEYMGVGKPIIHLSKIDDCPVQKLLEQYPLALCIKESELNNLDFYELGNMITELLQKPILTGKDFESLLKQYTIAEIAKAFIVTEND